MDGSFWPQADIQNTKSAVPLELWILLSDTKSCNILGEGLELSKGEWLTEI
jgi:hypothetical protein